MNRCVSILITVIFSLLIISAHAQENSKDSILNIIKEKYYSKGLIVDKEVLRKKILPYMYYDKLKSIDNIISTFGRYHFLKSIDERRREIERYINSQVIDSTLTFENYFDTIKSLQSFNFWPSFKYPINRVWDPFLTLYFPYDSVGHTWRYTDSADLKWNFVDVFVDSIYNSNKKHCTNIDSIISVIKDAKVQDEKNRLYLYFKLFVNLANKGFDYDIAYQSQVLNKRLLEEYGTIDDEGTNSDSSHVSKEVAKSRIIASEKSSIYERGTIVTGSFPSSPKTIKQVINSKGVASLKYISKEEVKSLEAMSSLRTSYFENPVNEHKKLLEKSTLNLGDEDKIFWILGTIKILLTKGTSYTYNVNRYFAYIYALLDENEKLKEKHYLLIRNLEVQFLHVQSRRMSREIGFSIDAFNILETDQKKHIARDSSTNRLFIQNFLLTQQLLDRWNFRQIHAHSYVDFYKLQCGQTLLNTCSFFKKSKFDSITKIKWNFYLLEEVREYYRLNYNFDNCVSVDLELLNLINKNTKFFSKEAFNKVVQCLYSDLSRAGRSKERKLLWKYIKFPLSLNSFENLNKKIESKKDYLTMSARYMITSATNINYVSNPNADEVPAEIYFLRSSVRGSSKGRIPEIYRPQMISLLRCYEKDLINRGFYKKAIRVIHYRESIEARYINPIYNHYEHIKRIKESGNKAGRNFLLNKENEKNKILKNDYDGILNLFGKEIQKNHRLIAGTKYELEDSVRKMNYLHNLIFNLENYRDELQFKNDSSNNVNLELGEQIKESRKTLVKLKREIQEYKKTMKSLKLDNSNQEKSLITKDKTIKNRNYTTVLSTVISLLFGCFIIVLLKQQKKLRDQKQIILEQKIISDSLRFGFGQFAHAARNAIDGFDTRYISQIPNDLQSEVLKIKLKVTKAIENTSLFLRKFDKNNKLGIAYHSLEDDIKFGAKWAQMEFGHEMEGKQAIDQVTIINDEFSQVMVPIYTIANIIHNSFKYTKEVKITVSGNKKGDFLELCIEDKGSKDKGESYINSSKHGTEYILRALESHNSSNDLTNYQAGLSTDNNSFKTTLNIRIKK